MGVSPEQLAGVYPKLYHMAEAGSWESIQRYGLRSTSALLSLFSKSVGTRRAEIESRRRPEKVRLSDPEIGDATIRDQKPLIESKLVGPLRGCTIEEWHRILNGRVFFWLTIERLQKLMCAQAYRAEDHSVLTVNTLSLATAYRNKITLTSMNTGNTQPIAHPRGPETFMRMEDYPFDERAKYGRQYQVVELAVEDSVPDICKFVISVETRKCNEHG
jgi:hypothetical protein